MYLDTNEIDSLLKILKSFVKNQWKEYYRHRKVHE